jgi:carboxyl-terminal processing protease
MTWITIAATLLALAPQTTPATPASAPPVPPAASAPAPMPSAGATPDDYDWFDPIIDIRQLVRSTFVDPADEKAMQEAALAAMVRALGDPYTVYVPPAGERDFNKEVRGNYGGIGAELDVHEGYLRVVSPLDGSPAREAGVQPGDLIVAVNGESTLGKDPDAAVELLLGEPGTTVILTLRRADGRDQDLSIVRREIQTRTAKGFRRDASGWQHVLDPERGIVYVRLTQFTETSAEDLLALLTSPALAGPDGRRPQGLILDLRSNGGGSLSAAIQTADLFQREGTIVSLRHRDGQGRTWTASAQPTDLDMPIVVLVNGASASASEILAGALQENGRAKVLGTRTFGKGSVQDVRPLPDGHGTLKMTVARYYLPSGRNITRTERGERDGKSWGVDPDPGFRVAMDEDTERAMLIARHRWEVPGSAPAEPTRFADPLWLAAEPGETGADGLADPQLAAALTALQERLAGRAWPRVGEDPSNAATAGDELERARAYRKRLERELDSVATRIEDLEREAAGASPPRAAAPRPIDPAGEGK